MIRLGVALACGCLLGCAADPIPHVQQQIAGGMPATDPAVVFVSGPESSLCTGSLLAPNLVLTAKHCVQAPFETQPFLASSFVVGAGANFDTAVFVDVREVRVPPGAFLPSSPTAVGEGLAGQDVALMILMEPLSSEVLTVTSSDPSSFVGMGVRAVGFGQDELGSAGVKRSIGTTVTSVDDSTLVTSGGPCRGDSGGPLLDEAGQVVGVSSFQRGTCGAGSAHYTRLDLHTDLIATAVADAGACTPDGEEICDGADNDCNGRVDETCTDLGEPCSRDDECKRLGLCADTAAGRVCTRICDARTPLLGCGAGLFCENIASCQGLCVPGDPGGGDDGDDCLADTDCASLRCVEPGDGRRRCAAPCESDRGLCSGSEVCAADVGQCGGCVSDGWGGPLGLGEACAADVDCGSTHCGDDQGVRYCSRFCDDDAGCGSGFHCRLGECVRGSAGSHGDGCLDDEDCAGGLICEAAGDLRFCTSECPAVACPDGFICDGQVCSPERRLLGEACDQASDCVTGSCASTSDGQVCTQSCSAVVPCPNGFACFPVGTGTGNACARPPRSAPPEEGGCAASRTGGGFGVFLLLLWGARRRFSPGLRPSKRRPRGGALP